MNKSVVALIPLMFLAVGCSHHAFMRGIESSAPATHVSAAVSTSAQANMTGLSQTKSAAAALIDARISQAIRQSIVNDDTMSVNAQNVCVQTNCGHVRLSGAVDGATESLRVLQIAQKTAGVVAVENWLVLVPEDGVTPARSP